MIDRATYDKIRIMLIEQNIDDDLLDSLLIQLEHIYIEDVYIGELK